MISFWRIARKATSSLAFLLFLFLCGKALAQGTSVFRINAGGPSFTDSLGQTWQADTGYYNTGRTYSQNVAISGTGNPTLYQTERYDFSSPPVMEYTFPVTPGDYLVRLHFAEIYAGAATVGKRIFDVEIEGEVVFADLDVFAEGGFRTALVKETTLSVADGALNLRFHHQVENPKISGIEIFAIGEPAPRLSVTPLFLAFPDTLVPTEQSLEEVQITNTGGGELTLSSLEIVGPDSSAFNHGGLPTTPLTAGSSVSLNVTFHPTVTGPQTATLRIHSNDMQSPLELPLSGSGYVPTPPQLQVDPPSVVFGSVQVGQTSLPQQITLTNSGQQTLAISALEFTGSNATEFASTAPATLSIPGGGSTSFQVRFAPSGLGSRAASLQLVSNSAGGSPTSIPVAGTGIESNPDMSEILFRLNAGGSGYTDPEGNEWSADSSFVNTGATYFQQVGIVGTEMDPLYQSERWDRPTAPELRYTFPVEPGTYLVRLHFAEIWIGAAVEGKRVFNVLIEGQPALTDYDIFAAAGFRTAAVEERTVEVVDNALEIEFLHQVENPKVSAIEIATLEQGFPRLSLDTSHLDFGTVLVGQSATRTLTVGNSGSLPLESILPSLGGSTPADFSFSPDQMAILDPGEQASFTVTFAPTAEGNRSAGLTLSSNDPLSPSVLTLTGQAESPTTGGQITATPALLEFSEQDVGSQSSARTVTLKNESSQSLEILNLPVSGTNASSFGLAHLPFPISLPPQGFTTVDVFFQPHHPGLESATLTVELSNPIFNLQVPFSGTGSGAMAPLAATPSTVGFGSLEIGVEATPVNLSITNPTNLPHTIHHVEILGDHPQDFSLTAPLLPLTLSPSQSTGVALGFTPSEIGPRSAMLKVHIDQHSYHLHVPLSGEGTAATDGDRALYRLNAGGGSYTDTQGFEWISDTPFINTGFTFSTTKPIAGTQEDVLYQSERWDHASLPYLVYALPVPAGVYEVKLHFAEIYSGASLPGSRVFDVEIEGRPVLDNYDIAASAGFETADIQSFQTEVSDGTLEIEFRPGANNPKVSAIEVAPVGPNLTPSEDSFLWGHVAVGESGGVRNLRLTNTGVETAVISNLSFRINQGVGHDFQATLAGMDYTGDHDDLSHTVHVSIPAGASLDIPVDFLPTEEVANDVWLVFSGNFPERQVRLLGTGGQETGHPFLHVVIDGAPYYVDHDTNGTETVFLDGRESHTHEFGHELVAFEWRSAGQLLGTEQTLLHSFPLGERTVSLTIFDDNNPPETLTGSVPVSVVAPDNVPGVLVSYHPVGTASPADLLENPLGSAEFVEVLPTFVVPGSQQGTLGASPYSEEVLVQLLGQVDLTESGNYELKLTGGSASRVWIDGQPVTGSAVLTVGRHTVEARFLVGAIEEAPLSVGFALFGGPNQIPSAAQTTHNETALAPVINHLPESGSPLGGETIAIQGVGFFPADQVVVHWGSVDLSGADLLVQPTAISLTTQPGGATIEVTIETPQGISNRKVFEYLADGAAPIVFENSVIANLPGPTQAAWGPDGRLYVATVSGAIHIYKLGDNYQVLETQVVNTLKTYLNHEGVNAKNILGIAFNPRDSADPIRLYVGHSLLFANGGACFDGYSPYSGQVSVLEGPNFTAVEPLITGLPVSNHDHGVNGMVFDNEGKLLISVGGNTNAGIPSCYMGELPESPLSAAILEADVMDPNFNGDVRYREIGSGGQNNDQSEGDAVELLPGSDVALHSTGFRNAFDLTLTTWGDLYGTDNGPNNGFGPASTGLNTQGTDPFDVDELNWILPGRYYGHPNRNRAAQDPREAVYEATWADPGVGSFDQVLSTFASSTNGIVEYRANTFGGAMRGNLLAQKWNGDTYRVILNPSGNRVLNKTSLPLPLAGLDVLTAPGGILLGIDYTDSAILAARPVDAAASGLTLYDIHPWRAPVEGGIPFTLGGAGFGTLANTTVSIGGIPASVTAVSPTRVHGWIPAATSPELGLVDVTVTKGSITKTLKGAFQYLLPRPTDSNSRAKVVVDPQTGTLGTSSTYVAESFRITNQSTSGEKLTRFLIDLRGAAIPDQVFDPVGDAGDPIGKDFTVDSDPGVGLLGYRFLSPNSGGFDVLEVTFSDFGPGETFTFSIDIDPTSIKGAADPGPNHAGSVSGLDLVGANLLVQFENGGYAQQDLYRIPDSLTGSEAVLTTMQSPEPSLEVVGVSGAFGTVSDPNRTVRVNGPAGLEFALLRFETALYLQGVPDGGFDIDEYESNTLVQVFETGGTIGNAGFTEVPVTLTRMNDEAGYNYFVAVLKNGSGEAGPVSRPIQVKLEP